MYTERIIANGSNQSGRWDQSKSFDVGHSGFIDDKQCVKILSMHENKRISNGICNLRISCHSEEHHDEIVVAEAGSGLALLLSGAGSVDSVGTAALVGKSVSVSVAIPLSTLSEPQGCFSLVV